MNPPHHCSVCSDAADRAIIRDVNGGDATLELVCSGATIHAAIDLVPGVTVGDIVLVHQGVAIAKEPGPQTQETHA